MDPILLATLVEKILPGFIQVFAGDQSGSLGDEVADAIKKATGTENLQDAEHRIDEDAEIKAQLQKDLAEIAIEATREQNRAKEEAQQIDLELYRLEAEEREREQQEQFQQYIRDLQDRQDARSMQTKLAEDHSPLAWVAPILAFLLMALIAYLLYRIMDAREPVVNHDVFNVVLGALVTAFTTVISYYFGSSVGSKQKDDALRSGKLVPNPNATGDGGGGGSDDDGDTRDARPPGPAGKTPGQKAGGDGAKPKLPPAPVGPPPSGRLGKFRQKAPQIMNNLKRDLGLSEAQAAGILGNIGVECAAFLKLQEQRPLSGRGGWGWCQWTGPRRKTFEQWATERHLDFASDEANYGFLLFELQGTQAGSLRSLKQAQSVESATTDFMHTFEKPAPQFAGLRQRIDLARLALNEYARAYNA